MIEIRHILCPIDFSEFSRHALHQAVAVAGWYESELTVLYVFATLPSIDLPPVTLEDAERDRLLAEMQRFVGRMPPELSVKLVVREASDVRTEILAQAEVLNADLVVIGSHGRSGFERLLLGSVTEKVMRKAPCPVMVVPRRAPDIADADPGHTGPPRILCAVDFSDGSLRALEYAMAIAEEAGGQLTVMHAIDVPPELREHVPVAGDVDVDAVRAAAEAACLRRLQVLVPESVRTYCRVETAVKEGAAHRQILQLAIELRIDLIVMGVQGRGAVDLLMFGSETAHVIRAATCPVLVVRGE